MYVSQDMKIISASKHMFNLLPLEKGSDNAQQSQAALSDLHATGSCDVCYMKGLSFKGLGLTVMSL